MLELIVLLVVIGVGLYLLQRLPMDQVFKSIIQFVVVVVVLVWLLRYLGLLNLG